MYFMRTYFSEINDEKLLNISFEVNITTEGNRAFVYIFKCTLCMCLP